MTYFGDFLGSLLLGAIYLWIFIYTIYGVASFRDFFVYRKRR